MTQLVLPPAPVQSERACCARLGSRQAAGDFIGISWRHMMHVDCACVYVTTPATRLEDTHRKDACLSVQAGPKVCHVLIKAIEVNVADGKPTQACTHVICTLDVHVTDGCLLLLWCSRHTVSRANARTPGVTSAHWCYVRICRSLAGPVTVPFGFLARTAGPMCIS